MKNTTINIEEAIQTINKQNKRIEELCLERERMNKNLMDIRNCVVIDERIYRDLITENYKLLYLVGKAKNIFSEIKIKIEYTNFEMVNDNRKLMKYLSEIMQLMEDYDE